MLKRWDDGPLPAFPPVEAHKVRIRFKPHEVEALGHLIALHRLGSLKIEEPGIACLERCHASRMWGDDALRTVTIAFSEGFCHDSFWNRMTGALDRIVGVPRTP